MPILKTVWYAYKFLWACLMEKQLWPVLWLPMMALSALFTLLPAMGTFPIDFSDIQLAGALSNLAYFAVFEIWVTFHLYRLCLGVDNGSLLQSGGRFPLYIKQMLKFVAAVFILPALAAGAFALMMPDVQVEALMMATLLIVVVNYIHLYPMLPAAAMGLTLQYHQAIEASLGTKWRLIFMMALSFILLLLAARVFHGITYLPFGEMMYAAVMQPVAMLPGVFMCAALFKNRYQQMTALTQTKD